MTTGLYIQRENYCANVHLILMEFYIYMIAIFNENIWYHYP